VPEITITFLALFIQLGNLSYCIYHAYSKEFKMHNFGLVLAVLLYALGFIPLIINSCIAGFPDVLQTMNAMNLVYNSLFITATFIYVLVVQARTMTIFTKVPSYVHGIALGITTLVWLAFGLGAGVVLPLITPGFTSSSSQILATGIWTLYSLAVDTVFSISFFYYIINVFAQVRHNLMNEDTPSKWELYKSVFSLASFFLCTWIGVWICAWSAISFPDQPHTRRFVYRVGYSVSTFTFTGAIYLLAGLKHL
ncbi:hypothetical protein EDD86DRAFT_182327, partial [Gorgonomyces haynaldii]